jgi:6-pyruvoyltetrahydropterin/6-carboxytetrahydropterin synthase
MKHDITIKHNFETAHRLPFLPGKCENIHGHSWGVTVFIEGPINDNGILTEFGAVKKLIRDWIDKYLDHGAMLGWQDPLRNAFLNDGTKVFWFGEQNPSWGEVQPGYSELPWPTVEAVAQMLMVRLEEVLSANYPQRLFQIACVDIQETAVNGAGCGGR